MKCLIWSQYYWPENFRINEIVQSLAEKGLEVEVLTGKPNYPGGRCFPGYRFWDCTRELHGKVTVHRIPIIPRRTGAFSLALNYLSFIVSGCLAAPWLLRKRQYDVIFVFAPSPILQAIPAIWIRHLKKCPAILWVQDLWPESLAATGFVRSPFLLGGVRKVVRWIYRSVDLLLVQSRAFVDPVQSMAGKTPVAYYPNSFTDNVGCLPADCPPLPDLDHGFVILFAGNIGAAQAVEVILDAAIRLRACPDIRFVIVGNGSRREWMIDEIRRHDLRNVELPGSYPVEAMPILMAKASVLLATLADTEIFRQTVPSKIQAYLAAGRPVIACLNGEGARIIEDAGAGLSCPAEDGERLAECILRLYGMPGHELKALGESGRRYFLNFFSHEKLVDQLIVLIAAAIQSSQGRQA
jgi:glycosyltransferase involved in cell wall biosynthesis